MPDSASQGEQPAGPLAGVHVLDLTNGLGELCGRYLGDLGADVVRAELRQASPSPGQASPSPGRRVPARAGESQRGGAALDLPTLRHVTHNVNKRAVSIAPGAEALWPLLAWADIVVDPGRGGVMDAAGVTPEAVLERQPEKVIVTISDFGSSGPYRDWSGSDAVHYALSGVLARSGLPGRPPLLPPGPLPSESTALQAAWVAVATYLHRLRTGQRRLGRRVGVRSHDRGTRSHLRFGWERYRWQPAGASGCPLPVPHLPGDGWLGTDLRALAPAVGWHVAVAGATGGAGRTGVPHHRRPLGRQGDISTSSTTGTFAACIATRRSYRDRRTGSRSPRYSASMRS